MGEVRVQVRITNGTDKSNAEDGLISWGQVRTYLADTVVDTGAVSSVIPQHVATVLGAKPRGERKTQYADGREDIVPVCRALIFDYEGREVEIQALILGDEVLLGQTFLELTDLMVDCTNRRLIGNPAHPDQPILKIR